MRDERPVQVEPTAGAGASRKHRGAAANAMEQPVIGQDDPVEPLAGGARGMDGCVEAPLGGLAEKALFAHDGSGRTEQAVRAKGIDSLGSQDDAGARHRAKEDHRP